MHERHGNHHPTSQSLQIMLIFRTVSMLTSFLLKFYYSMTIIFLEMDSEICVETHW